MNVNRETLKHVTTFPIGTSPCIYSLATATATAATRHSCHYFKTNFVPLLHSLRFYCRKKHVCSYVALAQGAKKYGGQQIIFQNG